MVVVAWWVDLLGQGWLGALAALWIAGLVLPLAALGAIELVALVQLSLRAFAADWRTRTTGPS